MKIIWFITITFLLLTFSRFNNTNSELGIYDSYNRSIVVDKDLNINNQLFYKDDVKLLTKNGFFYSHHSYASSILSTPFFLYATILGTITNIEKSKNNNILRKSNKNLKPFNYSKNSYEDFQSTCAAFGNFIIFLLSFYFLISVLIKRYHVIDHSNYLIYAWLSMLASPVLYYLAFSQSNPSLTIIFPLMLIFYFSNNLKTTNNNIFLGLSFGIGFIMRPDFGFYGILILIWWHHYKVGLKNILMQGIGLSICTIPFIIFEKYKLGTYSSGYISTFFFNPINIIDLLISPFGGVFLIHPITAIITFFAIYLIIKGNKSKGINNLELIGVLLVLTFKIFALALSYSHNGGTFGARQLMTDFLLLYLICIPRVSKNRLHLFAISLLALTNIIFSSAFAKLDITGQLFLEYNETYVSYLLKFKEVILYALNNISTFLNFNSSLVIITNFCIPLFIFTYITLLIGTRKIFMIITISFAIALCYLTSNSMIKQYTDKNAVLTNNTSALLYYENMGSIIERLDFLRNKPRQNEREKFIQELKRYHKESLKDHLNVKKTPSLDYLLIYKGDKEKILKYLNL